MSTMSFRELVQAHYVAKGVGLFAAKMAIHKESGVSMSALRNAYDGTRVAPETASALVVWARESHGVTLGYAELTAAPRRERARVDWGDRARVAIQSAVREAGLPDGFDVQVIYHGRLPDKVTDPVKRATPQWEVRAEDVGGVVLEVWNPDLCGALAALKRVAVDGVPVERAHLPENDNGGSVADRAAEE